MVDELLYEARDGIGCVTFNRPPARNALNQATLLMTFRSLADMPWFVMPADRLSLPASVAAIIAPNQRPVPVPRICETAPW